MNSNRPEEEWPSVGLAYEFVQPSYDWVLGRVNAVNTRIHQLQAFIATVTFAAPVLGKALVTDISFTSGWLYAALGMFALTVIAGLTAIWLGTVKLINPRLLYEEHLHLEPWRFKADLIYRAGEACDHNRKLVNQKWNVAVFMTVLLALEIVCLSLWISSA